MNTKNKKALWLLTLLVTLSSLLIFDLDAQRGRGGRGGMTRGSRSGTARVGGRRVGGRVGVARVGSRHHGWRGGRHHGWRRPYRYGRRRHYGFGLGIRPYWRHYDYAYAPTRTVYVSDDSNLEELREAIKEYKEIVEELKKQNKELVEGNKEMYEEINRLQGQLGSDATETA